MVKSNQVLSLNFSYHFHCTEVLHATQQEECRLSCNVGVPRLNSFNRFFPENPMKISFTFLSPGNTQKTVCPNFLKSIQLITPKSL